VSLTGKFHPRDARTSGMAFRNHLELHGRHDSLFQWRTRCSEMEAESLPDWILTFSGNESNCFMQPL
jgi:hypothetical protein